MVPKKILNFETFKCPFQYRYTIDVYFGKKKIHVRLVLMTMTMTMTIFYLVPLNLQNKLTLY